MGAQASVHLGWIQTSKEETKTNRKGDMKMKELIIMAAAVSGCINSGVVAPATPAESPTYLCVGMERSARFGECPGCALDAKRLSSLMSNEFGYTGDLLISEQATKDKVVAKLKEGVERTPEDGLFLFFYSGHGGQEALGGKEPDGADRKDEYLCLYDKHMLDDEIWEIVSKCRGRVFMYFDACHSATMYRSVSSELNPSPKPVAKAMSLSSNADEIETSKGFTFRTERFLRARPAALGSSRIEPSLLCWSGCKETEYSYGSSSGGTMTSAVMYGWKKGKTYKSLWDSTKSLVEKMQPGQNPVQTHIGSRFNDGMEAFK